MNPEQSSSSKALPATPEIIFTNWREILNFAPIPFEVRRDYTRAIEAYLDYCRHNGVSVFKESARDFMSDALRRNLAPSPQIWLGFKLEDVLPH